jgi:hypothetical protein
MLVILQGSLRHFPPAQLLPFLAQHGGTLDVDSKGRRSRLFFRDGAVIWGESPEGNDVAAIVASVSGEEEAVFTFLDGLELPANATPTPHAIEGLLEEAQRRALVARTFPDAARFRVVEAPEGKEISLKPEQFKLLFRIGNGRTFAELLADGGPTRDDLAASIRTLEANGLLERVDEDGKSAAAGEEAPASKPPKEKPQPTPEPAPVAETAGKPEKPVVAAPKKRAGALTSNGPDAAVHPLIGNSYSIGREAGNDIVVADASVSSRHARISRTADGFAIEDLGSRNGTFVNGEPVKQPVALADNNMVRLGKIMFTFNLAEELKSGEATERNLSRS